MTAKKPRFEPRVGWAVDKSLLGGGWIAAKKRLTAATHRVRVTDARDLTAEKAIADTITRNVYLDGDGTLDSTHVPEGYSARVVNGKVRVRRGKQ